MNRPTLFQTLVFLAMAAAIVIGEVRREWQVDAMKLEVNRLDNQIMDLRVSVHASTSIAYSTASGLWSTIGDPVEAERCITKAIGYMARAEWFQNGMKGKKPEFP